MHLVQILLPLYDAGGARQPQELFAAVRQELVDRFGGLTAYTRAPAKGLWVDEGDDVERDDIVVYEVMAPDLDRQWWGGGYRQGLAERFRQKELIVRAQPLELL
jgi:hypothetical protein